MQTLERALAGVGELHERDSRDGNWGWKLAREKAQRGWRATRWEKNGRWRWEKSYVAGGEVEIPLMAYSQEPALAFSLYFALMQLILWGEAK